MSFNITMFILPYTIVVCQYQRNRRIGVIILDRNFIFGYDLKNQVVIFHLVTILDFDTN